MSRVVQAITRPTRAMSASFRPVADDAVPLPNPAGTTYEMCLALEHDEPRLIRQFHRLVETITGQFPPDQGGTILFTGAGSSGHVADVAGYVAKQMTIECHSDVILVDADAGDRVLTQRFAAGTEKGLVEALQDAAPTGRFVVSTAVPRLAFLAFGESPVSRRTVSSQAIRNVVADWKTNYRYTVVAAGTALSTLTPWLARYCDATYLVVQLGQADKHQLAHFARQLTASGARLLGSVATGVRLDRP
jgi:Mrp family chromosome partitioning ATPase